MRCGMGSMVGFAHPADHEVLSPMSTQVPPGYAPFSLPQRLGAVARNGALPDAWGLPTASSLAPTALFGVGCLRLMILGIPGQGMTPQALRHAPLPCRHQAVWRGLPRLPAGRGHHKRPGGGAPVPRPVLRAAQRAAGGGVGTPTPTQTCCPWQPQRLVQLRARPTA
jgi:hypothetical protein